MTLDHAEIIRTHQGGVWRYLRFLGCDEAHADDLTQETFVSVLTKPFDYRGRNETSAYLRTVARNYFLMSARKDKRVVALDEIEARDEAFAHNTGEDDGEGYRDALRRCMAGLPDRARKALEMQYTDEAGRSTIAGALDMKKEALKTLLRRVKEALRDCIEKRLARA
ncbi:MAG: RNA polymerase sigma factor [Planctomycetes bacterium]|nr:RNA polymerase sigma factor [Planctomycetota bacterium]